MASESNHHDIAIRLWPELSDAIAAWREANGDLSTPDMVRRSYGIEVVGHHATHRRPSGERLSVRLEDNLYAMVRDAAALAGMTNRDFLLRRICEFLGVAVRSQGRLFGANVRKLAASKGKPRAALAGDPVSRWPAGLDPSVAIRRTDERQRWWKDGGVPPFRVPANAATSRHAERLAERRERLAEKGAA